MSGTAKAKARDRLIERWNKKPIGTEVRAQIGDRKFIETRTTSHAVALGPSTCDVCVYLRDVPGLVMLKFVNAL